MPTLYSAPAARQEPQNRFYPPQGANTQNQPTISGTPASNRTAPRQQASAQTQNQNTPRRQTPAQMQNRNTRAQQTPAQMQNQNPPAQQAPAQMRNRNTPNQQAPAQMQNRNTPAQQTPAQMQNRNTPAQQTPAQMRNRNTPNQQAPAQMRNQNTPAQQTPAQMQNQNTPKQPWPQEHNFMPHRRSGNTMYFEQRHPLMLQRLYNAADTLLASYGENEFIYDTYPDYLSLRLMRDRMLRDNQALTEEFLQAGCPIEWLELLTDTITSELLCRRRQSR